MQSQLQTQSPAAVEDSIDIAIGSAVTSLGKEFLKFTSFMENAVNYDHLNEQLDGWLARNDRKELKAPLKTLLAVLEEGDRIQVAKFAVLIANKDPVLKQEDQLDGKVMTMGEKINQLLPLPVTRMLGYRLAATPDLSAKALFYALEDIGSDTAAAKRFLGAPLCPFGYLPNKTWEKVMNSSLASKQMKGMLAEALANEFEVVAGK